MLVLRDRASIAAIEDPDLRALIEARVESLAEYDDYDLDELVNFVVVEPGDSLPAIDEQLGRPVLGNSHELIEEHAGYYELVYVLSDDGFGIEVFIPKVPGVDPALLAMCATNAQEVHDT
jgi:hypothetical protein